jgi:hypothetical protein
VQSIQLLQDYVEQHIFDVVSHAGNISAKYSHNGTNIGRKYMLWDIALIKNDNSQRNINHSNNKHYDIIWSYAKST